MLLSKPSFEPAFKRTYKRYADMRAFTRYFYLYQIGSRTTAKLNARRFDRNIRRLRSSIADRFFNEAIINGLKTTTFKASMYESSYNYLVATYFNRSLTENSYLYLLILRALSTSAKPLTKEELLELVTCYREDSQIGQKLDAIQEAYRREHQNETDPDWKEKDPQNIVSLKPFNNKIKELISLGLVKKSRQDSSVAYSLATNILEQLEADELQELYDVASLYTSQALLSVPGHYLLRTLRDYTLQIHGKDLRPCSFWQYRFSSFSKAVDDNLVYQLLKICHHNGATTIDYSKAEPENYLEESNCQKRAITPQQIKTEYPYHRQYLLGSGLLFKIETILNVGKAEPAQNINAPKQKLQRLELHFDFSKEPNKNKIMYTKNRLNREAGWMEQRAIDEHHLALTALVADPISYIPWLQSFHKYVVLDTLVPQSLATRLSESRREVLANYGIIQ